MAVDTAPRRFSMLGFGDGWLHITTPPDNASSAFDRATDLGLYYGFDYVAAVEVPPILTATDRSRALYEVADNSGSFYDATDRSRPYHEVADDE